MNTEKINKLKEEIKKLNIELNIEHMKEVSEHKKKIIECKLYLEKMGYKVEKPDKGESYFRKSK